MRASLGTLTCPAQAQLLRDDVDLGLRPLHGVDGG